MFLAVSSGFLAFDMIERECQIVRLMYPDYRSPNRRGSDVRRLPATEEDATYQDHTDVVPKVSGEKDWGALGGEHWVLVFRNGVRRVKIALSDCL